MAKCGWCGCYFEDGYKCSGGVVVGNYRYYSFCSQKCFYEARNREDIETEQKAAAAEAERKRRVEQDRRWREENEAKKKECEALREKLWKDAEKKERKEEENRSPEELKVLEEKAKSYGYESYSAMQNTISQVKQILNGYNNYYAPFTNVGWIHPKTDPELVRKMFGSAFPAERCLAVVSDNGNEGIAFTDSAFYSTLGDVSQISYADIEDIEDVSSYPYKKYILTAKNGKKIKIKYDCTNFGLDEALGYNFGRLLQALAKEGKKNPNVARIEIVANKMTMGWKIFWMVVLALIAFVIFKCTH